MPLNKTPVYRNLRTRVTFLYLEYEDLIAVLLIAPVSFFLGMKLVFQWGIPAIAVVLLLTFKYGKPRGYLRDWWSYQTKPHVYCGLERDSQLDAPYLMDAEGDY